MRSSARGRSPRSGPVSLELESAPLGVKVVCALGAIASIVTLALSLEIMAAGGAFASLGVLFVLLTVGQLIVLYGLWTLRPWSWKWGLVVFAVNALLNLVQGAVGGALLGVAIAVYLYTKRDHYRG